MTDAPEFHPVDTAEAVATCFGLMHLLRPSLSNAAAFVARWQAMAPAGYRLLGLWQNAVLLVLAGYRVQENLVHGRFLYVDDLVSTSAARGHGHGSAMLSRLRQEAQALGCAKLVLDTARANTGAQRFYARNGMAGTAMRFTLALDGTSQAPP